MTSKKSNDSDNENDLPEPPPLPSDPPPLPNDPPPMEEWEIKQGTGISWFNLP